MAGSSVSVNDNTLETIAAVVLVRASIEDLVESTDQQYAVLLNQLSTLVKNELDTIRSRERTARGLS